MTFTRHSHPLLAALLAAVFIGLSGEAAAVDPAAPSASSAAGLQARVDALIGDAACETQGQCRVVGIGAKPCGGPAGYRAWSDKTTDAKALDEAVQAQARVQMDDNKRSGLASDCMQQPVPTAVCRPRVGDGKKKTCQLGQGGVGSPV